MSDCFKWTNYFKMDSSISTLFRDLAIIQTQHELWQKGIFIFKRTTYSYQLHTYLKVKPAGWDGSFPILSDY